MNRSPIQLARPTFRYELRPSWFGGWARVRSQYRPRERMGSRGLLGRQRSLL